MKKNFVYTEKVRKGFSYATWIYESATVLSDTLQHVDPGVRPMNQWMGFSWISVPFHVNTRQVISHKVDVERTWYGNVKGSLIVINTLWPSSWKTFSKWKVALFYVQRLHILSLNPQLTYLIYGLYSLSFFHSFFKKKRHPDWTLHTGQNTHVSVWCVTTLVSGHHTLLKTHHTVTPFLLKPSFCQRFSRQIKLSICEWTTHYKCLPSKKQQCVPHHLLWKQFLWWPPCPQPAFPPTVNHDEMVCRCQD